MANTVYSNFYLSNEIEDQFNSHLDLVQFCAVDRTLEGTAGMKRVVNVYKATDGTEKLTLGQGNTKSIEVSFTKKEYDILLAQNRFKYYDEEAMTDPMLVPAGTRHMGTDMFNTVNGDVFKEFQKTSLEATVDALNFDALVDAAALLNSENIENIKVFGFVCPKDMAKLRKALKDDLKYVEAFARQGYVGTAAGINLYTKKDAEENTIIIGTKDAVTMFVKKGTEIEQERDGNTRENTIYSRKYYLAALTDETKAVKITVGA